MEFSKKKLVCTGILLSSVLMFTGCAPVMVGGAAVGTTSVAIDRRSAGDITNDNVIETKAALHLTQTQFSSSHINSTSYEGNVLLTGEVGNSNDKAKASEIVYSVNGVKRVYNELAVQPNASLTSRMNDSVTAGKVRAALIDTKGVTLTSVKVVVERGTCYLLGAVTAEEAAKIAKVASTVKGVTKVVKLFKIISEQELQRRLLGNPANDNVDAGEG